MLFRAQREDKNELGTGQPLLYDENSSLLGGNIYSTYYTPYTI